MQLRSLVVPLCVAGTAFAAGNAVAAADVPTVIVTRTMTPVDGGYVIGENPAPAAAPTPTTGVADLNDAHGFFTTTLPVTFESTTIMEVKIRSAFTQEVTRCAPCVPSPGKQCPQAWELPCYSREVETMTIPPSAVLPANAHISTPTALIPA